MSLEPGINWRGGLLRVGAILYAGWIVGYLYWARSYVDVMNWLAYRETDDVMAWSTHQKIGARLGNDFLIAFVAPLGFALGVWLAWLALGLLIRWVAAGFKADRGDE